MNKYKIGFIQLTIIILQFAFTNISSQNLIDGAESVAFDSLNNRYLVTSLRGNKVISIDKEGNQSIFKENIVAFGNSIKDSVLYVTGGSRIRGLDIFDGQDIFSVSIPEAQQLDGITYDSNGNLYVLATVIGKVFKVNIKTKAYSTFVESGFGAFPQDLIYDKFQNRVLTCQWHANSSILAINLEDSVLTTVAENTAGFADGITIDQHGNVYVSQNKGDGEIYKYDNDFSKPGELIYSGIEEPSGIDYNRIDDVLAIPSFSGDRVEFINMPPIYLFPKIGVNIKTGHAPLSVRFTDESSSNPKINKWEWDFNSDGTIDSYKQNPDWTFNEAGVYKISANYFSDSLSKLIMFEDSIIVFDGESSINFSNPKSVIKVKPTTELNLSNEWTFEGWVKSTTLFGKYLLAKNSVAIYTNKRSSGLKNNSLVIKFIRDDGSTIRFSSEDSSMTLNEWQHIALSYSFSNKKMEVYINGKLQELNVDYNSIFTSPIKSNSIDTLLLGNNITGLRSLNGTLDEVRIWNRDLSKDEIDANRYKYLNGNEDGLVAYWNINEGNGDTILDNSSNENNGEIIDAQYDWGIDYQTLVGVKDQSRNVSLPNNFSLKQNYPNPFNPSTIIEYSIPKSDESNNSFQNVSLKIYDVLGCEVATLVNEKQNPGKYRVEFDASNLSSGVYLYRVVTDYGIATKKMIIIR